MPVAGGDLDSGKRTWMSVVSAAARRNSFGDDSSMYFSSNRHSAGCIGFTERFFPFGGALMLPGTHSGAERSYAPDSLPLRTLTGYPSPPILPSRASEGGREPHS